MAKISKAKINANRKWNEANYYRVALSIPKEWEAELKQYAKDNETTVNKLLNKFIESILGKEKNIIGKVTNNGWNGKIYEDRNNGDTTAIKIYLNNVEVIITDEEAQQLMTLPQYKASYFCILD